jgi:signal peptidase
MTTPVPTTPAQRRTPAGALGEVLLWIAAIGGAICIVVVLAAVFFNVTLIMFKTGSMEPTIPTGSLAVVQKIPASEVAVGDIVTVDRPGQLPVTHRVTSVAGTGDSRTLTLRGDANETDDMAPYVVQDVRLTWVWIPGWASVVVWF